MAIKDHNVKQETIELHGTQSENSMQKWVGWFTLFALKIQLIKIFMKGFLLIMETLLDVKNQKTFN